eukprot:1876-Heterococcus_DN1.PRE.2
MACSATLVCSEISAQQAPTAIETRCNACLLMFKMSMSPLHEVCHYVLSSMCPLVYMLVQHLHTRTDAATGLLQRFQSLRLVLAGAGFTLLFLTLTRPLLLATYCDCQNTIWFTTAVLNSSKFPELVLLLHCRYHFGWYRAVATTSAGAAAAA